MRSIAIACATEDQAWYCDAKYWYLWKQTRGNEFIPCSNNFCHILKCFCSFKISHITLIWPKALCKHSVYSVASQRQEKMMAAVITIVTSSTTFLSLYISCWWRQAWDRCIYFMDVSQSEARVSTEHGITKYAKKMPNKKADSIKCIIQISQSKLNTIVCLIQ